MTSIVQMTSTGHGAAEAPPHESSRSISCPICGALVAKPAFRVAFPDRRHDGRFAWPLREEPGIDHWVIARCGGCGVGFPEPLSTEDEIVRAYAEQTEPNEWEIEHYVNVRPGQAAGWEDFAERLTRLAGGPGRLLEIGCAAGHLLAGAIRHGWEVMGVEASPKFSNEVKRRGIPVHAGALATMPAQSPFDLVVMTDVLEHLADPVAELERCRRVLRSGGLLVIATCDIGSLAARYHRLDWRQIVIGHTFYWTKKSLRIALHRAGFDTITMSSVRYWDPDPQLLRRRRRREAIKLLGRLTLLRTWMPFALRFPRLQAVQARITRGRFDFAWLESKVGNQAVMADVALVVGRARHPGRSVDSTRLLDTSPVRPPR